jgi:hypothetical protein
MSQTITVYDPRKHAKCTKTSGLPSGVSEFWSNKRGRKPHLYIAVNYAVGSKVKIRKFYVGCNPSPKDIKQARSVAIECRLTFEHSIITSRQFLDLSHGNSEPLNNLETFDIERFRNWRKFKCNKLLLRPFDSCIQAEIRPASN